MRHGLSKSEAQCGADAAMENFALWRSRIYVPPATHDTLSALAEHYPLVAITNGNADPKACGLDNYFQFVLRSGPHGRAKPFRDMYHKAANHLDIPLKNILHVGDDLTTDVAGSLRCGMQACWINDRQQSLMTASDSTACTRCSPSPCPRKSPDTYKPNTVAHAVLAGGQLE